MQRTLSMQAGTTWWPCLLSAAGKLAAGTGIFMIGWKSENIADKMASDGLKGRKEEPTQVVNGNDISQEQT